MGLLDLIQTTLNFKKDPLICKKCSMVKQNDYTFIPPKITNSADIVLVGLAPGKRSLNSRSHLNSKIKNIILLLETIIPDVKIYTTNIIKCIPLTPAGEVRAPKPKDIKVCGEQYIYSEIKQLKPKLVILFGCDVFKFFFGNGFSKSSGHFLTKDGVTYLPLEYSAFLKDDLTAKHTLNKIKSFLDGSSSNNLNYTIIDSEKAAEIAFNDIFKYDLVAVDIETSEITDKRECRPRRMFCFSVAVEPNKAYGFYFEASETPSVRYREYVFNKLKELLENKNIAKVFHNAKFEWIEFKKRGVEVVNYHDTMLQSFLLDENRPSHSLKDLANAYTRGYTHLFTDFKNIAFKMKSVVVYNCEDTDFTLQLHNLFYPQIKKSKGLSFIYNEILLPGVKVLATLELNGVRFDVNYARDLEKELNNQVNEINTKLIALDDYIRFVDLNSSQQLADYLFKRRGYEPQGYTQKGAPSVDKHAIEKLYDVYKDEFLKLLLKRRELVKWQSTYVIPLPKKIGHDGRINSSYNGIGTVTGRLASSNPNLQNIPRVKKIKNMFVADEGWVLLQGDFSQAELRIACSIANEQAMIEVYRNNGDIHKKTASFVMDISIEKVTKKDRQAAKAINFGFLYGMQAAGFKDYAKASYGVEFTLEEAKKARDKYFQLYSALPKWHAETEAFALEYGFVYSPLGRIRHLPKLFSNNNEERSKALRQAINSPVQGTGSDFTVYTMRKLLSFIEKFNYNSKLVLTVHDSIVLTCPSNEVQDIVNIMLDITETLENKFVFLKVPMKMDFEIGPRYGSLKEIKGDLRHINKDLIKSSIFKSGRI